MKYLKELMSYHCFQKRVKMPEITCPNCKTVNHCPSCEDYICIACGEDLEEEESNTEGDYEDDRF